MVVACLRRLSIVVAQHSAEALSTSDATNSSLTLLRPADQLVAKTLVISLQMVVCDERREHLCGDDSLPAESYD